MRAAPIEVHFAMTNPGVFKKPTIKATSRAYVRLFEYFKTPDRWLPFLDGHKVVHVPFGMHRNGDCALQVVDLSTGRLAILGLDVPNEIQFHTYVATGRSFWNERFTSDTHRRHRTTEIGCASPSKDEVAPR